MVGTLAGVAAATAVVIGTLALTGSVTYPVDIRLGPVSIHNEVTMPVAFGADVCQKASVMEQDAPRDCLRLFIHQDGSDYETVRVQDADVRPTSAMLTGTVELATTGGWSPLVAASVARNAVGLAVISAVLLLLWRLLVNAAAGTVFSDRAVRYVRGIGWLLIVGGVVESTLNLFTSATQLGYSIETFGYGPHLAQWSEGGLDLTQLALGGLILLLAEVFRHGAAVEAEHRLTV
ncbi:MAG: DUF2975 domain-containing protein [Nocardioides sp.]|uniref:DUF2975 domain-containing protein n=1 Tax=Nocardioides sp. TaxID=35761 RepID=UPI0039E6F4E3